MNIAQAKEQVFNTLRAYSAKNEYGDYILEPDQQRPIFLMGPPGIGKTAIVRQAAEEMELGLVSYSITHHTRQSALGLPKIIHKQYGDESFDVTEYTMSEIIASVYDCMESSRCREGILFLAEVNCASETLTPSMLQFLQFKTFGSHKVPDGWIVVTAGNPVSYNRNAKEFDIVTWDRLKRVDIEPDYEAWKAYAYQTRVHASILSYLEVRKENFYKIEETVDGKRFVTARGWSDLSTIIRLYEDQGISVDRALIGQYIQDDKIADDFASYYDLFNKYRSDYKLNEILAGEAPEEIRQRAVNAPFDEKLALIGLLLDKVNESISEVVRQEDVVTELRTVLKEVKDGKGLSEVTDHEEKVYTRFRRMGVLSADARAKYDSVLAFLREHSGQSFDEMRTDYEQLVSDMKEKAKVASARLDALFSFAEDVWGEGQEILILVTELTIGYYSSRFIARYGCEGYYKYSESLKFYERKLEILKKGDTIWT